MSEQVKRNIFIVVILVLLGQAVFYSVGIQKIEQDYKKEEKRKIEMTQIMDTVPLDAFAVSIYDISSNKEIYGRNDELPLPIASIAKVMTVVTALTDKSNNEINISFNALMQPNDYGFFVNEKFDKKELSKFILVGSSNDGAYALGESTEDFIDKMNTKAEKLGMEDSIFINTTGFDEDESLAGAYASASDVNTMVMYALLSDREIFEVSALPMISIYSLDKVVHKIHNTNNFLDQMPNIIFSKTGFTDLAGGTLSVVYKDINGHEIAITVLGSTYNGRFTDLIRLVKKLETAYKP